MLFSKTLKLLICLVMILPYILYGSTGQASAASNYNHNELMQYEGYGKAMYESVVEQTTFLSGQYTDNKEYVKGSINAVKDFAKGWYDETSNTLKQCFNLSLDTGLMDCYGAFTEVGGATLLTVGDWFKKFFSDYDVKHPDVADVDYSPYSVALEVNPAAAFQLRVKSGFVVYVHYGGNKSFAIAGQTLYLDLSSSISDGTYQWLTYVGNSSFGRQQEQKASEAEIRALRAWHDATAGSVAGLVGALYAKGYRLEILKGDTVVDVAPGTNSSPERQSIIKYINDDMSSKPMRVPEPKPSLTCPGGEKINLTVDGSTFIGSDGKVMLVNKNGTATVNGTSCALQWQTPQMDYIDDKPAMTDKDGNWIDMVTGDILKCMVTGDCKPSVPGDKDEVEELDTGLIEYVKNAYKYATGVLKTATDGLKSLAAGAKDLTALFGVFFGWLPPEMVVLMSSGLGIAIGLRLFRK